MSQPLRTWRCDGILQEAGTPRSVAVQAANEHDAIRAANKIGVLPETVTQADGLLCCPYCQTPLQVDVAMVGQMVTCRYCQAQVTMPDTTGRVAQQASGQVLFAIIGAIISGFLIIRGCALMDLADQL